MAQHFDHMKVRIHKTEELVADDEASKTDVAEKQLRNVKPGFFTHTCSDSALKTKQSYDR